MILLAAQTIYKDLVLKQKQSILTTSLLAWKFKWASDWGMNYVLPYNERKYNPKKKLVWNWITAERCTNNFLCATPRILLIPPGKSFYSDTVYHKLQF